MKFDQNHMMSIKKKNILPEVKEKNKNKYMKHWTLFKHSGVVIKSDRRYMPKLQAFDLNP